MLTELYVSLFSILLAAFSPYTLFLYFSFLRTGFCNLLIFSLNNKFPSLPLFRSPSLSFSRSNFRPSLRSQFGFALAAFPFYSSSFLQLFGLFFIHSNTVKSCFQAYVLFSQNRLYFFSKKIEAVIPFQVRPAKI